MAKDTQNASVELVGPASTALQAVYDTVPHAEIISALVDSGDERAIQLAERLSDDKHTRANLAKHCFAVKMQPREVWNLLIDSRKLEARLKMSSRLSDIVTAVAEAAVPRIVTCPKCKGTGREKTKKGAEPVDCTLCNGVCQVVREPDKDSQKMALEIGELYNVKVPLVAQQFNTFNKQSTGSTEVPDMSEWTRATDAVFEERTKQPIIEAEVVK